MVQALLFPLSLRLLWNGTTADARIEGCTHEGRLGDERGLVVASFTRRMAASVDLIIQLISLDTVTTHRRDRTCNLDNDWHAEGRKRSFLALVYSFAESDIFFWRAPVFERGV